MKGMDLVSIINAFNAAQNAQSLDAAMDFFADDAVVRIEPPLLASRRLYRGKQEIRGWVQEQLADNWTVEASNFRVAGQRVCFRSHASADRYRLLGIGTIEGAGEATICDGKIRLLSFRLSPDSLRKMQIAGALGR